MREKGGGGKIGLGESGRGQLDGKGTAKYQEL
jgi:hypothetical protein